MSSRVHSRLLDGRTDAEMGRITTGTLKRYRSGVIPDWIVQSESTNRVESDKEIAENMSDYSLQTRKAVSSIPQDFQNQLSIHHKDDISTMRKTSSESAIYRGHNKKEYIATRREPLSVRISDEDEMDYPIPKNEAKPESIRPIMDKSDAFPKAEHVFIPKAKRETIKKNEEKDYRAQGNESTVEQQQKQRREKTKKMISELLKEEKLESITETSNTYNENLIGGSVDPKDIVTDDDVYEEWDFSKWKQREIARLKRDNYERENIKHSQSEQVSTSLMSVASPLLNVSANINQHPIKERTKMKFLQKYYHQGAFFQTDSDDRVGTTVSDPIYQRDYWAPTAVDSFDKTLLPSVMQVKNFGRRGRTKWTHLVAEDTTNRDNVSMTLVGYGCKHKELKQRFEKPSKLNS